VLESVDDRLGELVARVRIDLVLAADAELPQSLVCGAAPLGQHEIVGDSVRLVERRKLSVLVFLDCLRQR